LFELSLRNDLNASNIAHLMVIKVDSVYRRKNALIRKVQKLLELE
jgi:hypothetical protein